MMDNDKKWEEQKQLIIFLIFSLVLISGAAFFLLRNIIGIEYFKIAYYELLAADKINHFLGNIFKQVPFLKKYFYNAVAVNFDFKNLSFVVTTKDGGTYTLIDYTIRYLWFLNVLLLTPLFLFEIWVLNKISKLSSKFRYDGIKNKQLSLYFNDEELLQGVKRKTIKMWDPVQQEEIDQFVFADYFPPYFPEEEGWFRNYVENSIYYSNHPINTSEERYNDIEKVWKSIIMEHTVKEGGKRKLPILKKYQFKRFEYMDKENLLEDMDYAKKELSIFLTPKNRNYEGAPVRNLFNSENSNKVIRNYIRKYHNEYYGIEEDTVIDWTHILIEDLKVYFEVKFFRKTPVFTETFLNDTMKNQKIHTPLLLKEEFDEEKKRKQIEEEMRRKGINPDSNKNEVAEKLEKLKQEFMARQAETILKAKKYYSNLKYLLYDIRDPKLLRFKQPVLKRTYIMTPFNGTKNLLEFQAAGIKIPAKILNKYIIADYEKTLKEQIKELKDKVKGYSGRGIFKIFAGNASEEEIKNLKALITELESRLDKENEESRKARITEILETHKFEETCLISLWEYGMSLVNLPTGRLSVIKKKNIAFWYAFTSLGRPFTFKAGVPIEVMRQIEIEKHSVLNRLREKYEDPTKSIRDFIGQETLEELKKNSLDFDDEENEGGNEDFVF